MQTATYQEESRDKEEGEDGGVNIAEPEKTEMVDMAVDSGSMQYGELAANAQDDDPLSDRHRRGAVNQFTRNSECVHANAYPEKQRISKGAVTSGNPITSGEIYSSPDEGEAYYEDGFERYDEGQGEEAPIIANEEVKSGPPLIEEEK